MSETKGRKEREEDVAFLKQKVTEAKSIIFTDYQKLNANQMSDLRSKLRDIGAEVSVAKNTLLGIALEDNKIELKGPTMTIFSYEDAIEGIKILFDFSKDNEDIPQVKAGIVEGVYTDANQLETLSNLPSKDQLRAQVVGGLKSPLNGLVNTLGGVQKSFVYALADIARNKEDK